MKNIIIAIGFLISFIIISENVKSNDLTVTNISLHNKNTVSKSVYVTFDIKWDNSWRLSTASKNWDAAWVFIKFRIDNGTWKHATLSTDNGEHFAPSEATVDPSKDGVGVFIYRSAVGSGTFDMKNIQLKWLYGSDGVADDATKINIKVFGIEMVYVNEGEFYVGDGVSSGRFWDAAKTDKEFALIGPTGIRLKCDSKTKFDDDLIKNTGVYVVGTEGISYGTSDKSIDNVNFPTGYKAFYSMKHEISNEQYAEFLNTLTRSQQQARTYRDISGIEVVDKFPINRNGGIEGRNCIQYSNPKGDETSPVYFFCNLNENDVANEEGDGQYIPVCNLGWPDACAYADWSGLRPMTELEFEKACIGPETPIPYGFAWHTDKAYGKRYGASEPYQYNDQYVFAKTDTIGTSTSYPTNPAPTPSDIGNAQYSFTVGHHTNQDSPLRVGIFATASSDRVSAGASYYGILDLSGTISERTVTLGVQAGRTFQGSHGDGYLSIEPYNPGDATNEDWPGYVSNEEAKGVVKADGTGYRGGDWNDAKGQLTNSFRGDAAHDVFVPGYVGLGTKWISSGAGHIGAGFRCVRSAD